MQTTNYDSTFCGSVPLHQINLIQPYGILIVLEKGTYKIVQVSENITDALGLALAEIVNTLISNYIPVQQMDQLKDKSQLNVPFTLSINKKDYLALTHEQEHTVILELELQSNDNSFISVYQKLKYAMERINRAHTVEDVCKVAAVELKQLSGYDKVMVYQFDKDWNGTVIAEELEQGMETYLGLTFPASDIPRQARAMYLKNPYRMIPNRDYTPVGLYPVINPLTNAFTDLSACNLRSVPAVHLEYMKNMKIETSMSCRILKDGELWGLFSCHHRTPYYLPYEGRALFELLSDIIAARIVSMQYKGETDTYSRLHNIHTHLVEKVYNENDLFKGLLDGDANVLNLLASTGAVLISGRRLQTAGNVPGKNELKDLLLWLGDRDVITQINNLPDVYEPARDYADVASGLLIIPIQPHKGEFLLVFRPEVLKEVNWGGNPGEAIQFEKDNIQYHPRNSFNIWQQKVRYTSLPWEDTEMSIAGHLHNFILEYIIKGFY